MIIAISKTIKTTTIRKKKKKNLPNTQQTQETSFNWLKMLPLCFRVAGAKIEISIERITTEKKERDTGDARRSEREVAGC